MARSSIPDDIKMLMAALPEGTNLSEWCRRVGISRETARKWRARYRAEGLAGLEDRSRAPKRPHGRVDETVEDLIVSVRKELADAGHDCGPASIWDRMSDTGLDPPSESTIWRVLVRRGQVTPAPKKRPRVSFRRFERERPNECWQGDDTHYLLESGQEVRVINLLDDRSRLNVDSLAVAQCRSEHIWRAFSRAVERYGLPAEFLNDNGRAWISRPDETPVIFQAHLARLGIRHLHSSPYHPQTCGKVERFHQTQRRWLNARPPARTLTELQALLDEFRDFYNHHRRHRSLGRRKPADVWGSQPPATPVAAPTDAVTISHCVANASGAVDPAHRLQIALGRRWARAQVTVIRRGDHAIVIDSATGEIARELTIDPTRRTQPTGQPPGGPRQPRRHPEP
jgi:transposase InsO family protein